MRSLRIVISTFASMPQAIFYLLNSSSRKRLRSSDRGLEITILQHRKRGNRFDFSVLQQAIFWQQLGIATVRQAKVFFIYFNGVNVKRGVKTYKAIVSDNQNITKI